MLTREEAKKTQCPYRSIDDFKMLKAVTRERHDFSDNLVSSCKERQALQEEINKYFDCNAEQCPKWKDVIIRLDGWKGEPKTWCNHFEDCPYLSGENSKTINYEQYLNNCLKCPKHFGRCGG